MQPLRTVLPLALAATALAACGDTEPVDRERGVQLGEEIVDPAPQLLEELDEDAAEETPDERFSSAYGTLDLDECEVLDQQEEGDSASYRCDPIAGVPIFVQAGDGRFDLDAGVADDEFQTITAFNEIAPRIEIRMDDGEPFAVIFRYRDVTLQSNNRTVLAVESIGTPGSPGCRIAQIGYGAAAANQRAREIADLSADISRCPPEPQVIGDAQ